MYLVLQVHMFTSITTMLESSLQAVYASFRAVIGVAEQFTLLKHQLLSVLSTLSALKFLQWLFRRILVAFRLRPANFAAEVCIFLYILLIFEHNAQVDTQLTAT